MRALRADNQGVMGGGAPIDTQSYVRAILNILDDAAKEKENLAETQRAVLNILQDSSDERAQIADSQRAVVNILDDFMDQRRRLEAVQNASLNILEDAFEEKAFLAKTQSSVLNILEDSAEERVTLEATQRAVINILDDVDVERKKVEQTNIELREQIAERVRTEEALRQAKGVAEAANKELEAFSYSVAHDLRAPLRGIDGFSQALLEDCAGMLNDEGKTYLRNMRESAQHMANLIDGLLSLARMSREEMHRARIDLSAIARTVFAGLQRNHPDRMVELVMPEEMVALGDARLLGAVIENLLGNAWKFTRNCARARIEIGKMSQAGGLVYFVRDNGAGFDMVYAKKLFAVFQRLHRQKEFEGTGIGLALVERIIQRHGGRIWGEGEVGRGATFYFTLEEGT